MIEDSTGMLTTIQELQQNSMNIIAPEKWGLKGLDWDDRDGGGFDEVSSWPNS